MHKVFAASAFALFTLAAPMLATAAAGLSADPSQASASLHATGRAVLPTHHGLSTPTTGVACRYCTMNGPALSGFAAPNAPARPQISKPTTNLACRYCTMNGPSLTGLAL